MSVWRRASLERRVPMWMVFGVLVGFGGAAVGLELVGVGWEVSIEAIVVLRVVFIVIRSDGVRERIPG